MSKNDKLRFTAYAYDPAELTLIGGKKCPEGGGPVDTDDGPEHPLYDARVLKPLQQTDIDDVVDLGVHTPIQVRKDGGRVVVVAGRNRVRWARAAKEHAGQVIKVPLVFVSGKDKEVLGRLISENEHRDADDVENRADKARRMMSYGATEGEVAARMRLTVPGVKQLLAYFDLAAPVQHAIRAGEISPTAAVKLKSLDREAQVEKLDELRVEAKSNGHAKIKVKSALKASGGADRPGIRVATKVLTHPDAAELPDGFLVGVRWMLGEIPAEKVRGLTAILRGESVK